MWRRLSQLNRIRERLRSNALGRIRERRCHGLAGRPAPNWGGGLGPPPRGGQSDNAASHPKAVGWIHLRRVGASPVLSGGGATEKVKDYPNHSRMLRVPQGRATSLAVEAAAACGKRLPNTTCEGAFDVTEVTVWLRPAYPALAAVRVRQPALMSVAHEGVSPAVVRLKGYAAPESSGGIPLRDSRGEPSVGGGAADPHGALGCTATSGAVRTLLRLSRTARRYAAPRGWVPGEMSDWAWGV